MSFETAGAEAMRIDSSGNVLVGTTSAYGTTGTTINAAGLVYSSADADRAGQFDRTTNDGEIVRFSKAGTTVGSIGTEGGDLAIGNGDAGLQFINGTQSVRPFNMTTNARLDNAIDLGMASTRFKDLYLSGGVRNVNGDGFNAGTEGGEPILIPADTSGALNGQGSLGHPSYRWKDAYLSGGVYLGGTGAANKLDDYEEGTWTPILALGSHSYGTQEGKYTKIGNQITVWAKMTVTSRGSSASELGIGGLPFASGGSPYASTFGMSNTYGTAGLLPEAVAPTGGSMEGSIAYLRNQFATNNSYSYNHLNSSGGLTFAFTYRTA